MCVIRPRGPREIAMPPVRACVCCLRRFDAPTVRRESNPGARICEHLKSEARSCTHLVLWLDCDREGENICFEVCLCVCAEARQTT